MLSNKLSIPALMISVAVLFLASWTAIADTAAEIDRDVDNAMQKLYARSPTAQELSTVSKAILVFPKIVKGGLIIGGQYGEGALRVDGRTQDYYSTAAASYGLQVGVQSFGYALFFMTDDSLEYLARSDGWEVGVGPTVVVLDDGMAKSFSTTTAKEGIYAIFFDQKGLMAGLSIQGSKIRKIQPD